MAALAGHFVEPYTVQGTFVVLTQNIWPINRVTDTGTRAAIALMQDLCRGIKQMASDATLTMQKLAGYKTR